MSPACCVSGGSGVTGFRAGEAVVTNVVAGVFRGRVVRYLGVISKRGATDNVVLFGRVHRGSMDGLVGEGCRTPDTGIFICGLFSSNGDAGRCTTVSGGDVAVHGRFVSHVCRLLGRGLGRCRGLGVKIVVLRAVTDYVRGALGF